MIERLREAAGRDVSRETLDQLHCYVDLLRGEAERQNLVSRTTLGDLWDRHIIDSAQLCRFVQPGRSWLDIGSGAGLPGLIVAILTNDPISLVEPRRLRAEFLQRCVDTLKLSEVAVQARKVERMTGRYDAITARAVASLDQLFALSYPLSHDHTRWVLPKGRGGAIELAEARRNWQGRFQTEASITDQDAVIILAERVRPNGGSKGGANR
jgi:16S rRNA (guanine527-N7)-methyltransferase